MHTPPIHQEARLVWVAHVGDHTWTDVTPSFLLCSGLLVVGFHLFQELSSDACGYPARPKPLVLFKDDHNLGVLCTRSVEGSLNEPRLENQGANGFQPR